MQEDYRIDIIKEIEHSGGYDIALMTTFNFEIGYFERMICNRLEAQDVKKISIFVDAKEFTKSISEVDACYIGRKYMVNPVNINGTFHPKLILLLGDKKAKLIIGSANLKATGFSINNEVFNCIAYSSEHPEALSVINAAINYFLSINNLSYQLDNSLLDEVRGLPYFHKTKSKEEVFLLNNLEESIIDHIQKIIDGTVHEIDIAVPYYDNALHALRELMSVFPEAKINLYLQNEKCAFSIKEYNKINRPIRLLVYDGFLDNDSGTHSNFYHGKVFLFKTDEKAFVLYGSTNCTMAALLQTTESGGNAECDLFCVGEMDEYDYFFQNMDVQPGVQLVSHLLTHETEANRIFFYRFGEVINDQMILHIGYSKEVKAQFFIEGEELEHKYQDEELLVTVPKHLLDTLTDIFSVEITYGNNQEELRCWAYCPETLQLFRQKENDNHSVEQFRIDSEGSKYIQDRINLLKAEILCVSEVQEYKEQTAYIKQIEQEQECVEDDLDNPNDYIVNIEILEEYRRINRKHEAVKNIRKIFLQRLEESDLSLYRFGEPSNKRNSDSNKTESNKEGNVRRQPDTDEQKFERFVRNRIQGMNNQAFVNAISTEHYLGIVAVILDIFNKYQDVELFDIDYIVETRTNFFIALLKKDDESEAINLDDLILQNCYFVLLNNIEYAFGLESLDEKEEIRSLNRDLLMAMEKKYLIRSNYQNQLRDMLGMPENKLSILFSYIEDLFGYKNFELLFRLIQEIYPGAIVTSEKTTLKIECLMNTLNNCHKPNQTLLVEIRKYSHNVSKIEKVIIIIKAKKTKQSSALTEIKHIVNYRDRNWRKTEQYDNGTVRMEAPVFINV